MKVARSRWNLWLQAKATAL